MLPLRPRPQSKFQRADQQKGSGAVRLQLRPRSMMDQVSKTAVMRNPRPTTPVGTLRERSVPQIIASVAAEAVLDPALEASVMARMMMKTKRGRREEAALMTGKLSLMPSLCLLTMVRTITPSLLTLQQTLLFILQQQRQGHLSP